jgi:hypothetical protein
MSMPRLRSQFDLLPSRTTAPEEGLSASGVVGQGVGGLYIVSGGSVCLDQATLDAIFANFADTDFDILELTPYGPDQGRQEVALQMRCISRRLSMGGRASLPDRMTLDISGCEIIRNEAIGGAGGHGGQGGQGLGGGLYTGASPVTIRRSVINANRAQGGAAGQRRR